MPSGRAAQRRAPTIIRVLRHILMIRLKPVVTAEQVEAFMQAIESLPFPGRQSVVVGRDIETRPGNTDLAVSNDFSDEGRLKREGTIHSMSWWATSCSARSARI